MTSAIAAEPVPTDFRSATIAGTEVFYREAGPKDAPALLLLHGFPSSSHMFRDLIPRLSGHYRVIAPDFNFMLIGAGFYHDRYRRTADGWRICETGYDRTYDASMKLDAVEFKVKPGRALNI